MRTESLAGGAAFSGLASDMHQTEIPAEQELSAFRGIAVALTASLLIWGVGAALFLVLR